MITDKYGIKSTQEINLRMLKEIDRVCTAHKINYALDSATLIGAIREQGFIPWDDDVDIAMTRTAWDEFRKICETELDSSYKVMTPQDLAKEGEFYDFTPRLTLREDGKLWIDIFILDNLPDGLLGSWAKFRQKVIYLLAMGHRKKIDYKKYSFFHKLAVAVMSNVGKLYSMETLCKKQEKLSRKYNNKKTANRYYSNYQPDYLYVTLKTEWTEKFTRHIFEDFEPMIPVHYDEILTIVYGDYMKRPPQEERIPPHEAVRR